MKRRGRREGKRRLIDCLYRTIHLYVPLDLRPPTQIFNEKSAQESKKRAVLQLTAMYHLSSPLFTPHLSFPPSNPTFTFPWKPHSSCPRKQRGRNLRFHSLNNILLQTLRALDRALLNSFDLLACGQLLLRGVVGEDAGDLDYAHEAEEEVYGCEPVCH